MVTYHIWHLSESCFPARSPKSLESALGARMMQWSQVTRQTIGKLHVIPFASHSSVLYQTLSCSSTANTNMSDFYSLKATKPDGTVLHFADLKGKAVLIVNTASAWYVLQLPTLSITADNDHSGFTSQYTGVTPFVFPCPYLVLIHVRSSGPIQQVQGKGFCRPRIPLQPGIREF